MARKQQKIKVVSYVHVGEQLVETSRLSEQQKQQLGVFIRCNMMNEQFRGKAKILPPEGFEMPEGFEII
ncbi:MAG: hypothetical protein IKC03_02460 [Oscillospiraceae bacterium]|nr:hypothetical protein [Oscillospiraceae bacterium]